MVTISAFPKVFLTDKNQDMLQLILSFLSCRDLGCAAVVAKSLNKVITSRSNKDINAIWIAADTSLTKRPNPKFSNYRMHCYNHLSVSKFVDECEDDEIETPHINADGILANFLNICSYDDPEEFASMVAEGRVETASR